MPLNLDYTFRDSPRELWLAAALKVDPARVDITVTRTYVKINQAPYLLQLDLFDDINIADSSVVIDSTSRTLLLKLRKAAFKPWPQIKFLGDVELAIERRNAALAERAEYDAQRAAADVKTRHDLASASVRSQMALEEEQRQLVDEKVAAIRKEAQADVFRTLGMAEDAERASRGAAAPVAPVLTAAAVTDPDVSAARAAHEHLTPPAGNKNVFVAEDAADRVEETAEEPELVNYLPPPRGGAVANGAAVGHTLTFTPRVFPTPLRESKVAEETEWLTKNSKGFKSAGRGDPAKMMDATSKAEQLMSIGDYASALHAFQAAHAAPVYGETVAPQLALCMYLVGNTNEAATFAATAIHQAQTRRGGEGEDSQLDKRIARLECVRALCDYALQRFDSACSSLEGLCRAGAASDAATAVLAAVRDCAQQDESVWQRKLQADACASRGDNSGARTLYKSALGGRAPSVAAHVNGATVEFREGQYESCQRLCAATDLILRTWPRHCPLLPIASIPGSAGSVGLHTHLLELRVKTFVKQAAAASAGGQPEGAIAALERAKALSPGDVSLDADIATLRGAPQRE